MTKPKTDGSDCGVAKPHDDMMILVIPIFRALYKFLINLPGAAVSPVGFLAISQVVGHILCARNDDGGRKGFSGGDASAFAAMA
ncbi:hypothetical protein F0562_012782 [Nyssa sinensis]|uniref:Uncharacterized protein n=1 Tax=Nyssa sinensis TaxID=561372 RepID=A0A5J4ZVI1_9ASTE|nr:hypothetical protein F0562_012782 [Nyssa sinensis]